MLEYHRMTEDEKYTAADWKYDGEYAIYNDQPYDEQKKKGFGFANPKNILFAFYDGSVFVGFTNLYEEESEVFFGIGANPGYCGKGYGQKMTEKTIELSHELFPGKRIYLEVRTWNRRAVRCYEKAGFRITGEAFYQNTHIVGGMFYRMTAV